MAGGAIVTVIGIAIAVSASLDLPASWNTAIVGVSLLAVGALRSVLSAGRGDDSGAPHRSDRGSA